VSEMTFHKTIKAPHWTKFENFWKQEIATVTALLWSYLQTRRCGFTEIFQISCVLGFPKNIQCIEFGHKLVVY